MNRLAWMVLSLTTLWPLAAAASDDYPYVVERELGVDPPPCWICHTGDVEGRYTVHTPFGLSLRARGLFAEDEASLVAALAALAADEVDSDGDTFTDVDELAAGTNPNIPEGDAEFPEVTYGCSVVSAGPNRGAWAAIGSTLLALVALLRRRARGTRSTPPSN
jgi:MYXO-CTERM domain-containing protein